MKAGVYYNNHDVRVEELPIPGIGPGEILVKAGACGVCGSDVLEWYRIKKAPIVLGHEMAGEIFAKGSDVTGYEIGQRVFVSHHIPCNTCYYCLRGFHTACETLHTTNYDPGGFSEYVRIPALNVDRGVFPLPDEMNYDKAVFIEPLACVVRAQRLSAVKPGHTVLVIGAGISGILHVKLARALGASRIIATDISSSRRKAAEGFGADYVLDAASDVRSGVLAANRGRLADIVIVCAGAMPAFKQALECVDRGGTVLCFATANPGEDLPVPINEFWRNEIKLMPSYGNAPLDAVEAMELIRSGRVVVEDMITHRLPLDRIGEAFEITAAGQDSAGNPSLKVVVEL